MYTLLNVFITLVEVEMRLVNSFWVLLGFLSSFLVFFGEPWMFYRNTSASSNFILQVLISFAKTSSLPDDVFGAWYFFFR